MSVSQFPVNRNPTALLRFLGLTGPDAPNRVADFIQGVVDLVPWWLEANTIGATQLVTPGVGATGFLTLNVVPANQRWLLTDLSIGSAVIAAAHTLAVGGCTRRGNPLNVYLLGEPEVGVVGGVLGVDCFSGTPHTWLLLNPGESVGAYVHQNSGATPAQLTVNYRYASFAA